MWKESLPPNCPSAAAKEIEAVIFRILKDQTPVERDFWPYIKIYPNNKRYKKLCKAYAVSSFNSENNAKVVWQNKYDKTGESLGEYIGKFQLYKNDGKSEFNPKTGHYSTWYYDIWEFKKITLLNSIMINAI